MEKKKEGREDLERPHHCPSLLGFSILGFSLNYHCLESHMVAISYKLWVRVTKKRQNPWPKRIWTGKWSQHHLEAWKLFHKFMIELDSCSLLTLVTSRGACPELGQLAVQPEAQTSLAGQVMPRADQEFWDLPVILVLTGASLFWSKFLSPIVLLQLLWCKGHYLWLWLWSEGGKRHNPRQSTAELRGFRGSTSQRVLNF